MTFSYLIMWTKTANGSVTNGTEMASFEAKDDDVAYRKVLNKKLDYAGAGAQVRAFMFDGKPREVVE